MDKESQGMWEELEEMESEPQFEDCSDTEKEQICALVKADFLKRHDNVCKEPGKLCKAEEKGECCLLSLQALMLGINGISFTFNNPRGVDMFAVKLKYCPQCGKPL